MRPIGNYLLYRHSPLCPPWWRFQWSLTVVGQGRPWPDGIDAAGLAALQLARHLASQGGAGANDDTDGRLIAALAALRIHRGDAQQRNLLEAWLLSGATDATIGQCLDLEPATVNAFEQIFYAVRDRRRAADWIIVGAIGWPIDPDGHRDITTVIKLLAFLGGPSLLEIVLLATGMSSTLGAGHLLRTVNEMLVNKARLLVSVLTNPPRGRMALRMWDQIKEIEDRRLQPSFDCSGKSELETAARGVPDHLDWNMDAPDTAAGEDPDVMNEPIVTSA